MSESLEDRVNRFAARQADKAWWYAAGIVDTIADQEPNGWEYTEGKPGTDFEGEFANRRKTAAIKYYVEGTYKLTSMRNEMQNFISELRELDS